MSLHLIQSMLLIVSLILSGTVASAADYSRTAFPHWSDLDHDGLNTRQELLIDRSLFQQSRIFVCPYTGYVSTNPLDFSVDHIVSLAKAWACGADRWTRKQRELFANDPENLELVRTSANESKGNNGPDAWLPSNLTYADDFIYQTKYIYEKYQLTCPDPDPSNLSEGLKKLKGVRPSQLNLKDRR